MDQSAAGSFSPMFSIVVLAVVVILIASVWKVFTKAGQPGWAAIVPIYNVVVLLKTAGKPVWWLILFLVPFVNIVILFIVYISLAKSFGKGGGFGIGLVLLPFIFFPVLAFGNAQYKSSLSAAAMRA